MASTTTTTTKKTAKPMLKHVDRTTTAYTGPVKIDATAVAPLLVDLPPGAKRGLRTAGPDIASVLAELAVAVPTSGPAAGVSATLYAAMVTGSNDIAQLTTLQESAAKLAEVIGETLAILQDQREQQLSQIADAVESTAKRTKNAGVAAPFQKTLAYKGEAAEKAAKTRAANKAAKAAAATATPPAPATTSTTTPAAATPVTPAATATTH
jgi:hypothetical protein